MSEFHQQLGAFEVWSFPSLDDEPDQIEYHSPDTVSPVVEEPEPELPSPELEEQKAALIDSMACLQSRIDALDQITAKINQSLSEIDDTMVNNIILLIKNAVKKIIHKEILLDDSVMKGMINESLDTLKEGSEACIVYVSEEDYHVLHHDMSLSQLDIRCDHLLQRGDFVIKTKLSEVEAILEQRLQSLFGL
ncbi:FliH/SctL family protein [Legionella sp. CNM-4043-24]|uniref:FliH/SctL family protein n=1 Tax=Legionella sp. CNM-4043-24 TaxID=3421646 RepID=UPI00403AC541